MNFNISAKSIKYKRLVFMLSFFYSAINSFAQEGVSCYNAEYKSPKGFETIEVYLIEHEKEVHAEIKKTFFMQGDTYSKSWEMEGTIKGREIVFQVSPDLVSMFTKDNSPIKAPAVNERWTYSGDDLIIDGRLVSKTNCKKN